MGQAIRSAAYMGQFSCVCILHQTIHKKNIVDNKRTHNYEMRIVDLLF